MAPTLPAQQSAALMLKCPGRYLQVAQHQARHPLPRPRPKRLLLPERGVQSFSRRAIAVLETAVASNMTTAAREKSTARQIASAGFSRLDIANMATDATTPTLSQTRLSAAQARTALGKGAKRTSRGSRLRFNQRWQCPVVPISAIWRLNRRFF